jgi:hypothetical protein
VAKITHIKPEWFLKRKTQPKRKLRSIPLLSLLSVFRPTVVQLFGVSTLIFILLRLSSWNRYASYILASVLAVHSLQRTAWLWPLIKRIYRFIPFENSDIRLFYDASLGGTWNPAVVVEDCQRHLKELSTVLKVPFRRKLIVFYFVDSNDVSKIFGELYGATALPRFNAIVIGHSAYVQDTTRHELTHLLAARWQTGAPPLLAEGIATWLGGSSNRWGQSIDSTAQAILLNSPPKFESLLKRNLFFSKANRTRSYYLAASFTGFLIRQYGWDKYKRLYRHSYDIGFKLSFRQLVGVSFEAAENRWREEIISGKWSKRKK